MKDADGYLFEGEFEYGIKNGKVKETRPNGIIVEGNWKNGNSDGLFKITYPENHPIYSH